MTTTWIGIEKNSNATQDSFTTTITIILEENNKTWYNTNEEYDSWHDAIETMDNHQDWVNPPMTNCIIDNIDPHIHQGDEHTNSLKSTILTPNSGWQFLHSMLYKIICCILLCKFKAKVTTCKTIKYLFVTLVKVVISTPTATHKWITKPWIRHTKKHCKIGNGSGKFSHNLRASKRSCYNEWNCKSEIHGCWHIFMKHKSLPKHAATNNSNQGLKIKVRKLGTFKCPLPQRLSCILRTINNQGNRQYLKIIEHHFPHTASLTCA